MRELMHAYAVVVRLVLLVLATTLVDFAVPTPDPFVVTVVWVAFLATLMLVGPVRRGLLQWVVSGRFRGGSATA